MPVARLKDVAHLAGVSVGTVSNVLNSPDKVSPTTMERVQRAIEELGFVRNDAARQLRAGSSRSIGLIVLDVGNPFFMDVARGAQDAAEEGASAILLGNSDQRPDREAHYLDLFEEQRVRGVLISPVGDVTERLARLRARGIPSVLVDRHADPAESCSVAVDDVAGGRLAVEHLVEQGCRRVAFVGGPLHIRQIGDRLAGARAAVDATGGRCTLEVVELGAPTTADGRAAGASLVGRDPGDRPDGLFGVNDLVALGLLQALVLEDRLRVPDDVALVGYDDIDYSASAMIPLSSVRQPRQRIGRTAVELVVEEAAALDARRRGDAATHQHRAVVYQPELAVRRSSDRRGEARRADGG